MKKHFMYYVSAFVLCMLSVVLLGACGKKDYDMSNISLSDATFTYDGNAHTIELKGELPNGVTADYKYYSDATYETEVTSPVDAGKYYVVVKFTGDAKHNPIEDKTATLTINKAVYPNLDVTLRATYLDDDNQEKTVMAKDNGDGTLYLESINKEYTISVNSTTPNGTVTTEFYNELNADGTVKESSKSLSNKLTNYGDKVHIKITLSDENHEPISVVRTITIERKTVEIRTYEDLENMNKDLFTKSMEERVNLRYLLLNDIDCEGKVWKTIGPGYQNSGKNFVGEFNGNGHTISNFKLTEDSLNYTLDLGTSIEKVSTAIYGSPTSCIHIGFFGYVVSADIHDITFDNVTTSINMKKLNDEDKISIHAYYGTAVARCEANDTMVSNINPCSSIYNVTVKNTNINIQAGKMFVGSIIGTDANKNTDTKTFLRKNLNAENVNISVAQWALDKKAVQRKRMSIGGIVGETQDNNIANYEDCVAKNINVEIKAHAIDNGSGTTLSPQNPYDIYTKDTINVGSILGYNKNNHAGVSLNNCISSNFNAKIYADNLDQVKFNGSYGNNDAKGNVDGAVDANGQPIPAFQVNNCTYTGVVEVYIMGGTIKDGIDANPDQEGTAIGDDKYTSYTPDKYDPNYVYVNGVLVTE